MKHTALLLFVVTCFANCGKDNAATNNGVTSNNGTANSNNASTSSNNASTHVNKSNNGTTAGTTNASNNTTSGSTGTSGTTAGKLHGVERYYTELGSVFCEIAFACKRGGHPGLGYAQRFPSQEECAAELGMRYVAPYLVDELASEAAGRLTVNETKLDMCLAELKDQYCYRLSKSSPSCNVIIEGKVAENGACAMSVECEGDAHCGGAGECGVCEPNSPNLCGGETCGVDAYCDFNSCQPKIGNGGACNNGRGCLDSSICDSGTCRPVGSVADGEFCDHSDVCTIGSSCESSVCEPYPAYLKRNEQCDVFGCEPGLQCSNISFATGFGTCLPVRKLGESCVYDDVCLPGLFCPGGDFRQQVRGTCVPTRVDGDICDSSDDCASLDCSAGVCVPSSKHACVLE